MSISGPGAGASSALESLRSYDSSDPARADAGVSLLRKAQNIDKQEGQALIQMIEQAGTVTIGPGRHLDAYA